MGILKERFSLADETEKLFVIRSLLSNYKSLNNKGLKTNNNAILILNKL